MAVTAANIKAMSESFADLEDAVINSAIADATLHIEAWFANIAAVLDAETDIYTDDMDVEWTEPEKEYLIRLHVAHDLSASGEAPTLESESIGDISTSVSNTASSGVGWSASQYGRKLQEFAQIKRGSVMALARA